MKNYICIDGKKAELTPEQLKALGLETEIESPFEWKHGQEYYFIDYIGEVISTVDCSGYRDKNRYNVANYCTNKEMMEQRALHETLNRLLWRYSMEHGGNKIDWSDTKTDKYCIYYNHNTESFDMHVRNFRHTIGVPYFHTIEIAKNAIKEIIEPFMAEHPDFKL